MFADCGALDVIFLVDVSNDITSTQWHQQREIILEFSRIMVYNSAKQGDVNSDVRLGIYAYAGDCFAVTNLQERPRYSELETILR